MINKLLYRYEKDVLRTEQPEFRNDIKKALVAGALGLNGEAGETAEVVKKAVIQGRGLDSEELIEEAGDTLYYLCYLLIKAGSSLEECIAKNVEKRQEKFPKGFK